MSCPDFDKERIPHNFGFEDSHIFNLDTDDLSKNDELERLWKYDASAVVNR